MKKKKKKGLGTDLSFIDCEVNAFENLLFGFSNDGGEAFDFEEELLLVLDMG